MGFPCVVIAGSKSLHHHDIAVIDDATLAGLRRADVVLDGITRHRSLSLVDWRSTTVNSGLHPGHPSPCYSSDRHVAFRFVRFSDHVAGNNCRDVPVRRTVLAVVPARFRRSHSVDRASVCSMDLPTPARQHQRRQFAYLLFLCCRSNDICQRIRVGSMGGFVLWTEMTLAADFVRNSSDSKSSASFGWGYGGNAASVRWKVNLTGSYDPL